MKEVYNYHVNKTGSVKCWIQLHHKLVKIVLYFSQELQHYFFLNKKKKREKKNGGVGGEEMQFSWPRSHVEGESTKSVALM